MKRPADIIIMYLQGFTVGFCNIWLNVGLKSLNFDKNSFDYSQIKKEGNYASILDNKL